MTTQTFTLQIASDNLTAQAQILGTTTEQLKSIKIKVDVTFLKLNLSLTYKVVLPNQALAKQLDWPEWQSHHVSFENYLWEQTCLECFLTANEKSYVEINVSPKGAYALYQFEDYRSPSTLPPVPLLQSLVEKDVTRTATIAWEDYTTTDNQSLSYQRSFNLALSQLPYNFLSQDNAALIHPCVILYFDNIPLYFATNHAKPADFHQRRHWSSLKLSDK